MGCISSSVVEERKIDTIRRNFLINYRSKQITSPRDKYVMNNIIFTDTMSILCSASKLPCKEGNYFIRIAQKEISGYSEYKVKLQSITGDKICLPYFIHTHKWGDNLSHVYGITKMKNICRNVLEAILEGKFILNETRLRDAFEGAFEALNGLHSYGMVHGQITPDRVLYQDHKCYLFDIFPDKKLSKEKLVGNDLAFIAPENIRDSNVTMSGDVWSLGAVLFYLLSGSKQLLHEFQTTVLSFGTGKVPLGVLKDEKISEELITLLDRMLDSNPNTRITSKELIEHPWMKLQESKLHNEIIFIKEHIRVDFDLQKAVMSVVNSLAIEKDKEQLYLLINIYRTIDYGTGYITFNDFLIKTRCEGFVPEMFPYVLEESVNYSELVFRALALRDFIYKERLSALFFHLSSNNKTLGSEEIKKFLRLTSFSDIGDDEYVITGIIKTHQIEDREETTLTLDEYTAFCKELCFFPHEDLLS